MLLYVNDWRYFLVVGLSICLLEDDILVSYISSIFDDFDYDAFDFAKFLLISYIRVFKDF